MMHFEATMHPLDTLDSVRKHVLMLATFVCGKADLDLGQDQTDAFHANLLAVAGGIEAAVKLIEARDTAHTAPANTAPSRPAPVLTEPRAKAPKRRQRAA